MELLVLGISSINLFIIVYILNRIRGVEKSFNTFDDYFDLKRVLDKEREINEKLYQRIQEGKAESYEVTELLSDLASGKALVKIERVNPQDFFLRKPKGQ